jgi:DNA processing protein
VTHCATIAVLATGTDRCYPERHRHLKERILTNGCVMSEYPPGTAARPYFFLARNRIIAGLANAVIVIEAPLRSGSLATARHAAEANRDVLVVPGAVDDPQFEGSNALIREGATLVRNIEDVFEGLGVAFAGPSGDQKVGRNLFTVSSAATPDEAAIITLLKQHGTLSIDKLVELTKLSTHVVSRTLTMLALRHAIQENDNRYALAR